MMAGFLPQQKEIADAVDKIIESGSLGSGSRLSALLNYVVAKELEGKGDQIKAYSIAIDVLGRPDDFDPSTDSIVRVEFNRLRQALEHYYAVIGRDAKLRIDIPKGTYRPKFSQSAGVEAPDSKPTVSGRPVWIAMGAAAALALAALIVVVVFLNPFRFSNGFAPVDRHVRAVQLTIQPFSPVDAEAGDSASAERITDALMNQLAGNSFIDVIIGKQDSYSSLSEALSVVTPGPGDKLVLAGVVRRGVAGQSVLVGLMNPADGRLVWSHDYDLDSPQRRDDVIHVAESIVSDLQPPLIVATKKKLAALPEDILNAWELYLLASVSAGDKLADLALEKHRAALAERALQLEPNLGEAHAALASRLSLLILADPESDTPETREKLLYHARRAERLAPQNPSVFYEVGLSYMRMGDREHAEQLMRRASELDPSQAYARILSGMFDGVCGAASPEMIDAMVREDARLADGNPVRWLTQGMLARLYLNSGQPKLAYFAQRQANQVGANPDMIFQYAAILNELGRTEDAAAWLDRWREDWPTLDVDHYADAALPRMCGDTKDSLPVRAPYIRLAKALDER